MDREGFCAGFPQLPRIARGHGCPCPLLLKYGPPAAYRYSHAFDGYSGIFSEFLLAFSIANLTKLPQSLDETEPHPSLLTVSYTPSSRANSFFRLSDIMPLRLLMIQSLLKSKAGPYIFMFSRPSFFILRRFKPMLSTVIHRAVDNSKKIKPAYIAGYIIYCP
jgi:hypothetical protein